MKAIILITALATIGMSGASYADPDKDESGKGRWRGGYDRYDGRYGYEEDARLSSALPMAARSSASGRRVNTKRR
jgi:hypothetical protein